MSSLAVNFDDHAIDVSFTNTALCFVLADGREISAPLEWFPTLRDATEKQKSYIALTSIIEKLIENGFRKNNRLFAIGGGITQDITAFISSIMYRGVEWIFFPTTLLAQADSCIGGKTSINIGKYKNQLGNFYPPRKIFIIPEFISTLPELAFKSGMGEMLHFYLVSGENDFSFYQHFYDKAFTNQNDLLKLVHRNL